MSAPNNPYKGLLLCSFLAILQCISAEVGKLVCFYDAKSFVREGPAQMSLAELEPALQFCNFLVYGYAGIDAETYKIKSLDPLLTHDHQHYRHITALRQKFPHVRFLLSVGGDRDLDSGGVADTGKYLRLLEQPEHRRSFQASVIAELKNNGFDGLDLAWQFPKNRPKVQQGVFKRVWGSFRGWFSSPSVDEKAQEHREQFATLLGELQSDLRRSGQLLTVTMLPHVSAELFIDVPKVLNYVDFVNLGTYDFQTPERDPKVADLPAPLYSMYDRDPSHNVQYQVQYWMNQTSEISAHKLHVGVASYGRAWNMTRNSGITGYPPIPAANGAAPAGRQTVTPGLLSWPETCDLLQQQPQDREVPHLRKVGDPTKRFGIYAYRAADDQGENGLWVGYEDPTTAAIKAGFVQAQGLGGVAFHDLSLDDFRGQCAGEKFPILRSIKYKL
ncbi:chitinase-like protein Idgf5 [Drosophila subpulchrella]|uniref:chitinase-like protein Idgf5 n=1 Tax=Drosophila subpulchrella TaxID=1486046 RepID=UPI0018A1B5AC|nr:chitinase-like protein Idgf5 [Drosophila subpulchrella]